METVALVALSLLVAIFGKPLNAVSHLQWYRQKFDDYPGTRKAIIPGVW